MDRDALTRELTQEFQQSLKDAMDAVERAPDGAWIAGSEWQVREAFQKLTTHAFERILQAKMETAENKPAVFSPDRPGGKKQRQARPERVDGRR
jgi:hypothetical protein